MSITLRGFGGGGTGLEFHRIPTKKRVCRNEELCAGVSQGYALLEVGRGLFPRGHRAGTHGHPDSHRHPALGLEAVCPADLLEQD